VIRLVIEMRGRGEPWVAECNCTVDEFVGDNDGGLAPEEWAAIRALAPGESFSGGGGAAPEWRVTAEVDDGSICGIVPRKEG
jgi:hypothetical protein